MKITIPINTSPIITIHKYALVHTYNQTLVCQDDHSIYALDSICTNYRFILTTYLCTLENFTVALASDQKSGTQTSKGE